MAIVDLYSKRKERERNGFSDVYSYDTFSPSFRVQLSMMIEDLLGDTYSLRNDNLPFAIYGAIVQTLKKEYGVRHLSSRVHHNEGFEELHFFLANEPDVEKCLDAIELCYQMGNRHARDQAYRAVHRWDSNNHVDSCIEELNIRFKEAGCGYAFVDNEIIRIDSEFLHSETVKPAIHFLNFEGFEAARNEFFEAYEHYRHQRYKEALVGAAKSFESTFKIICTLNGWTYSQRDTSNKLIQILIDKDFMPAYNQAHLSAIQTALTSGIPTLRNNLGGHGDGPDIVDVPAEVVAYGLHLTASAIVMLAGLQAKRSV